jgi:hypothetical protein
MGATMLLAGPDRIRRSIRLHITVQFAAMNGMWIPFSVDAIATVRFLGIYSLSGLDLVPPIAGSSPPNP